MIVFQGKMKDNLTSADLPSYIQLMDPGETWEAWLASLASITPPLYRGPGSKTLDTRTGEQFIKLSSER